MLTIAASDSTGAASAEKLVRRPGLQVYWGIRITLRFGGREKIGVSFARGTHKFVALSSGAVKRPCGRPQEEARRRSLVLIGVKK